MLVFNTYWSPYNSYYLDDGKQDEVPVCNFCKELYPGVCGSGVNCNCECHNCGCDHKSGFNDDYVDELEYGDIACSYCGKKCSAYEVEKAMEKNQ